MDLFCENKRLSGSYSDIFDFKFDEKFCNTISECSEGSENDPQVVVCEKNQAASNCVSPPPEQIVSEGNSVVQNKADTQRKRRREFEAGPSDGCDLNGSFDLFDDYIMQRVATVTKEFMAECSRESENDPEVVINTEIGHEENPTVSLELEQNVSEDSPMAQNIAASHIKKRRGESEAGPSDGCDLNGSFDIFVDDIMEHVAAGNKEFMEECSGGSENDPVVVHTEIGHKEKPTVSLELEQNVSEDSSTVQNKAVGKRIRESKACPICDKKVKYLSEHIKLHKIPEEERKAILYRSRKRRDNSKVKSARKCPIPQCRGLEAHVRLSTHLSSTHNLSSSNNLYRKYIKEKAPRINHDNSTSSNKSGRCVVRDEVKNACVIFKEYLQSRRGGKLEDVQAKGHIYKLAQMLSGLNFKTPKDFEMPNFLDTLLSYLEDFIKSHCGSSTVTYLATLEMYLKCLMNIKGLDSSVINDLLCQLAPIKKSFRKEAPSKLHHKLQEVPIEDIKFFETCEIFLANINELESYAFNKNDIDTHTHTMLRGTLLLIALFRNSPRSCVLKNMKLEELNAAKEVVESDGSISKVIEVHEHKTFTTHGAADIALSSDEYKLFTIYCNYVRPIVAPLCAHDYLFVTWSGKHLSSDDVLKTVQAVWLSCGLKSKIGTNILRKTITTAIHAENDNAKKQLVAKHLKHNLSTAESFYANKNKPNRSVEAAKCIRSALGRGWKSSENTEHVPEANTDDPPYIPTSPTASEVSKEDILTVGEKKDKGRCFFSKEEREFLRLIFIKDIKRLRVPFLKEINEICQEDSVLMHLSKEKINALKIKGALQNLVNIESKKKCYKK